MQISQKIIDYSIWYYLKYCPSPKKLERKILLKFWPNSEKGKKYWGISNEEIEYILNEKLKNIIQEKNVIESKIRSYQNKNKSKQYIKQKLFERQEKKELIEKILAEAFVDWELENLQKEFEKIQWKYDRQKIIEKLIRKWFRYDDILKIIN
jgi:SOS response regulatory protein OraA/RecX